MKKDDNSSEIYCVIILPEFLRLFKNRLLSYISVNTDTIKIQRRNTTRVSKRYKIFRISASQDN